MSELNRPRRGFFAELRRRRVLRTLALYTVTAWVLMQVADVVFPALDIPEQAIRYLLLAAVLGFPVALVFAWLFNITPEGIRRTGRFEGGDADAVESLQGRDYAILGALAVVLGLIVYGAVDRAADAPDLLAEEAPRESRPAPGEGTPMVAVLPFSYRGTGDDAAFFAGGVHDDLLTQLSQLAGLRVISRTSVLKYEDTTKTIPVIGRELGADAILEGGVQLAGGQIRINAQLIDARSDEHLWAQTFDRELTPASIFAVQAEIARAIATALDATLSDSESSDLAVIPTSNMAAYRKFHESNNYLYEQRREALATGIGLLEEALELDPGFVKAMVRLVYALSLSNFGGANEATTARVEELLERIETHAPDSTDYLLAQGYYAYYILRDYDTADRLMELGRARAPSNTELVHVQSWIKKRQGDFSAWIDLTYLLGRLDPNEKRVAGLLMYRLGVAHRYEEALRIGEAEEAPTLNVALRLSRFGVARHHDLLRSRDEIAALINAGYGAPDMYDREELFLAHLSVRDYAAAEALLATLPDPVADTEPLRRIPLKLELLLTLHLLRDNTEQLNNTLARTRQLLGLSHDPDGDDVARLLVTSRIQIALAAGDKVQTRAALEEVGRLISDDIAAMIHLRSVQCRSFALLGDAKASVRCLRLGIDQPSEVMPFFEPLLPHYDGIRETAEFQLLLAELRDAGWLGPVNL